MFKNKSKLIIYLVLVFVLVVNINKTYATMSADGGGGNTTKVADTVAKTSVSSSVDSQKNKTTTTAITTTNGTTISQSVTTNSNGNIINQGISVVQWKDTSGNTAYNPDANLIQTSQSSESAPNSNDKTITTTVAVYTPNGNGTGGTLIGSSTQSNQYNQVTAGQPSDSVGGHNYTGSIDIYPNGDMTIAENNPYGNPNSTELGGKTQTNTATYLANGTIVLSSSTKTAGGNYDTYGGGTLVTYSYPTISLCETNPTDPKCVTSVNSGTGAGKNANTGNLPFCVTNPNDPSCQSVTPFCVTNPTDPSCKIIVKPFCVTNPNDPSCQSCTPEDCTGKACGYDAGCGVICISGTCPSGQECWNGTCVIPQCSITSFSINSVGRIILLGGSFGASWSSDNCSNGCTLSCSPAGCGKGLPDSNAGTDTSNYKITPTSSGSYSYTLTCSNARNTDSRVIGAGTPGDKVFKVVRPFWSETPAFLKLLIYKLFSK